MKRESVRDASRNSTQKLPRVSAVEPSSSASDATKDALVVLAEDVRRLRTDQQRLRAELAILRAIVSSPRTSVPYRGVVDD